MPTPVPPGGAVQTGQTVSYWENLIKAKWGNTYAEDYVTYAESHPGLTPTQAAQQFIDLIAATAIDQEVGTGVAAGAGVGVDATQAAVTGLSKAGQELSPPDFLGKLWGALTSSHTWIRLAEGVLGIALVLVAAGELGKGTVVGKAVKKVPFI